jgi:hypothetical protein
MTYRCFDFQESLCQSAELAVSFKRVTVYYRRARRRVPAIRRYFEESNLPETIGVYIENRRWAAHIVGEPLDGYVSLEAYLTETALRRLMARVRVAGMPAACQWVEEKLESGKLYVAVNRVRAVSEVFLATIA